MAHLIFCCTKNSSSHYLSDQEVELQILRNKEIEKNLKKEKQKLKTLQQILLLGTGESGKSTFLKQMKIISGQKWTSEQLAGFRDIIWDNIYKGVLFMLQARQDLGLEWEVDSEIMDAAAQRLEAHYNANKTSMRQLAKRNELIWDEPSFLCLVPDLKKIWAHPAIKKTFEQRARMITENFSENTRFYLNNLDSIGVANYQPTNDHIVWSRKPTDTIIEEEISIHGSTLVFIDVGGQTKERRKWCTCFEGMTSVLFVIACSHYDERYQDRLTKELRNKLQEAMVVFEGLVNHDAFVRVSIMIFFNKEDVLTEKIASKISNIRNEFDSFPENANPFNVDDVKQFIRSSFIGLVDHSPNGHKRRNIYTSFTTAVDTRNIETVFKNMKDTVLDRNLNKLMIA